MSGDLLLVTNPITSTSSTVVTANSGAPIIDAAKVTFVSGPTGALLTGTTTPSVGQLTVRGTVAAILELGARLSSSRGNLYRHRLSGRRIDCRLWDQR